jgi:hypothetical protein
MDNFYEELLNHQNIHYRMYTCSSLLRASCLTILQNIKLPPKGTSNGEGKASGIADIKIPDPRRCSPN